MTICQVCMADVDEIERGDGLRDKHVGRTLVADKARFGCACLSMDVEVGGLAFVSSGSHVGYKQC